MIQCILKYLFVSSHLLCRAVAALGAVIASYPLLCFCSEFSVAAPALADVAQKYLYINTYVYTQIGGFEQIDPTTRILD